jgi:hypothetical protein
MWNKTTDYGEQKYRDDGTKHVCKGNKANAKEQMEYKHKQNYRVWRTTIYEPWNRTLLPT